MFCSYIKSDYLLPQIEILSIPIVHNSIPLTLIIDSRQQINNFQKSHVLIDSIDPIVTLPPSTHLKLLFSIAQMDLNPTIHLIPLFSHIEQTLNQIFANEDS